MNKKFKNAFDYDHESIEHEVNTLPSETQPNMTLSLRQILERYTRGGEVATFSPVYQDHDEFDENPDIMKMDAMEKLQYAQQLKQSIQNYQNQFPPKTESKEPVPDPKVEPAKPSENSGESAKP